MSKPSLEELTRQIYEILTTELLTVGEEFTPETDLVAAGLDSLALTQLLLNIEESTGIWVDESELTPENLASTQALAKCVHAQLE